MATQTITLECPTGGSFTIPLKQKEADQIQQIAEQFVKVLIQELPSPEQIKNVKLTLFIEESLVRGPRKEIPIPTGPKNTVDAAPLAVRTYHVGDS